MVGHRPDWLTRDVGDFLRARDPLAQDPEHSDAKRVAQRLNKLKTQFIVLPLPPAAGLLTRQPFL